MSFGLRLSKPEEFNLEDSEYWSLLNVKDVQSITFYCEILPTLWEIYNDFSGELTLLDVGARTGAGTALIGYLHQKYSMNRIKISTEAIDIDDAFVSYAKRHYPFARLKKGDIHAVASKSYDIVLCSHTIEHVDNPRAFLDELKRVAKQHVVIACPFNEKNRIPGHRHTFDQQFFKETNAGKLRIYKSVTWHQSEACIAVYDVREKS